MSNALLESSGLTRRKEVEVSNVLVLYTGGTVGMCVDANGKLIPQSNLGELMSKERSFHDPTQPKYTTPVTRLGSRIHYDIKEYSPLIDSSNMTFAHWKQIANDIYENYDNYDGFVVLHGTDTMAYSASALSFMLMHLGKTVILTGSVIPLSQEPNDANDNIAGALLLAGNFDIPEVTIFFRDQLFRGNRTTKISASGLNAFNSANFPPLAHVGMYINVRWDLIRTPQETEQALGFRVFTEMDSNVGVFSVFPGMSSEFVRNALAPPLRGCVMRTFGTGNVCDDAKIIAALGEATARGVVIVNITQCTSGAVVGAYGVSSFMNRINIISCHDMTTEAALTKLAWALARFKDPAVVRQKMQIAVRGEMTVEQEDRRSWRAEGRLPSSRRTTVPSVTLATLNASSHSVPPSPPPASSATTASSSSSSSTSTTSSTSSATVSSSSAPVFIPAVRIPPSTNASANAAALNSNSNDALDGRNSTSLFDDLSSHSHSVNWTPFAHRNSLDYDNSNPRFVHDVAFPSTVGKSSQYSLPAVPFYVNSLPVSQAEETPY